MGEVVSGLASSLMGKLATRAYQEIALACGVKGDVEKLQSSVRFIHAFLADAENKQAENGGVAQWLEQLKGAFDDATDVLDEMEYEAKRREVIKLYGSTAAKVLSWFSCNGIPLTFRMKMAHKIRTVKEKIDELNGRNLGLVEQHAIDAIAATTTITTPSNRLLPWREAASFVPLRVSGRNEEKIEVLSLLMGPQKTILSQSQQEEEDDDADDDDNDHDDDDDIGVIPIVGIGGLGKTTLAQMVYNDATVKENFDKLIWVCVSDESDEDFDVKSLILKIVKAATKIERGGGGIDPNSSLDQLQSLLQEQLQGNKFLLVLDDVWNESPNRWDGLRSHLLSAGGSKGSKIIVTTRSNKVASITAGSGLQINLKPLPESECKELFFKCAFQGEKRYPRLEKIGEAIVAKCKGLPLALTTLGCLLGSKPRDEKEWRRVRDSELWRIDPKGDGILPSLRLSYSHLPRGLKQCFSYCSHFPKDYSYSNCELIMYWMAHGLLPTGERDQEPEHLGEFYIKELVSASLLQVSDENDRRFFDKKHFFDLMGFNSLKMHDLVHDLAKSTMKGPPTRTIRWWRRAGGTSAVDWSSDEFKRLKALYLQGMNFRSLPDGCFDKMKHHLRYLDLYDCGELEKLPSSTSKLQLLQSLVLYGCDKLQELPKGMMRNLVSLRSLHITVQATSLSSMDIGCLKHLQLLMIEDCTNLVSLPRGLRRLTALRKLMICGCRELAEFEEDEEGKQDLNLQVFAIFGSPKLESLPSWIRRSAKTLQYMGIGDTGLEALPEWLPNMESLDLLYIQKCPKLLSLPNNMDQLQSLQYLCISECPTLIARCTKDTGLDWHKVANVPHLQMSSKGKGTDVISVQGETAQSSQFPPSTPEFTSTLMSPRGRGGTPVQPLDDPLSYPHFEGYPGRVRRRSSPLDDPRSSPPFNPYLGRVQRRSS